MSPGDQIPVIPRCISHVRLILMVGTAVNNEIVTYQCSIPIQPLGIDVPVIAIAIILPHQKKFIVIGVVGYLDVLLVLRR